MLMEICTTMTRRGQARIIEAIVSAIIVVAAVSIASLLSRPPGTVFFREEKSLIKTGYSVINYMANAKILEEIIYKEENGQIKYSDNWEEQLKPILQFMIPANIAYNLTIYEINGTIGNNLKMVPINDEPISNIITTEGMAEMETIKYTYVCTRKARGKVLLIILQLGYRR